MRLIFKVGKRRFCREFRSWAELCEFISDFYPLIVSAQTLARIFQ
jgi:hypothetical protein